MKRFVLVLIVGFITMNSFSQTTCVIEKAYEKIFKIQKKESREREYLIKTVNKMDANSCFSDLVNHNGEYIDYLRVHFSDNSNYKDLMSINDTVKLQHEFIKSLEKDSAFNHEMRKLTEKITNKLNYVPDTVSMNELINIAVKYFSIVRINKNGDYVGKVCVGVNGLIQTEKERFPQVEAFCFSTILNNYKGEQFNMYNEFVRGIKELYKMNLGLENEDRLLRAQGAMYMFMRNNETLKMVLLA